MAGLLSNPISTVKSYQAPAIPNVTGGIVGGQKPPELNVMGALGSLGHSIASGYNAVAAAHQTPSMGGPSPLSLSGQLNTTQPLLGAGQSAFKPQQSLITPTATGGTTVHPTAVQAYSKAPIGQTVAETPASGAAGLAQYLTQPYTTPNGGQLSLDGNGNPTGFTNAQGYKIDTSGSVPSSALSSSLTPQSILQQHGQYSDYVNAVSQAQGYSPQYLQALQAQYGAQTQGQQLNLNSANINANLATGMGLAGHTTDQAQVLTGQQQQLNTLQQAQNSIQQLSANQALNTQQLARTGAISAAQTQLQYSPEGQAGSNALGQYNSLQQAYPGANIPEYNQSLTPEQNQQIASYIVSNSPAYKSQFQSQYQTPGGGTGIYNKLDTGGLQKNQDGTISLVSDATASLGAAQRSSLNQNVATYNQLAPAFQAANKDFSYITNFMQQAGINQSGIPAVNQVANYAKAKGIDPGVVAQFKAGIASLRTNYSAMLGSRGETPTQAGADSAQLIPDNITPEAMAKVQDALNANGQNILTSTEQQIQSTLSSISGGSQSFQGNSSLGGTSGGSIYDF